MRQLTTTQDKQKYGAHLCAEPDHKILGQKLKGDLPPVMRAIKELTDAQLSEFQQTGNITVAGHCLHEEDLRLKYSFDASSESANKYEAHSDKQVR